MNDLISRQAAIDALGSLSDAMFKNIEKGATYPKRQWFDGMANAESIIKELPSAQPEPAIPLSWIEGQIKWLKSLDTAFSALTAGQISAMVNKWKGEKDE